MPRDFRASLKTWSCGCCQSVPATVSRREVSTPGRLGAEPAGLPEGPPLRDYLYRAEFAGPPGEVEALERHIDRAIEGACHCLFLAGTAASARLA